MARFREGTLLREAADSAKALEDFQRELKTRRIWNGLETNLEFGKAIDCCENTAGKYQETPLAIRMDIMQKIVKALKPDIRITLRFLGYSDKEIKKFAADLESGDTKAAMAGFAAEFAKQLGGVMKGATP